MCIYALPGGLRIRSLNTSWSKELLKERKGTFHRMEEYIFCLKNFFYV